MDYNGAGKGLEEGYGCAGWPARPHRDGDTSVATWSKQGREPCGCGGGVGKSTPHTGDSGCKGREGQSMAGVFEEMWLEWGEPVGSRAPGVRGNGSGDADCVGPCAYNDFGFKVK